MKPIALAVTVALGLIVGADLWLVWVWPTDLPLTAAFDPAIVTTLAGFIWPALIAGAVLALALALPIQAWAVRRLQQTHVDQAELTRARHAGREAAEHRLDRREQRLTQAYQQLDQREAEVDQRIQAGVAEAQQMAQAARAAQMQAERDRDQALATARQAQHDAADAEKRRRNAAGAAERRRRQLKRNQEQRPAAEA